MVTRYEITVAIVSHLRQAGQDFLDDPVNQVNKKSPENDTYDRSIIYRIDTRTEKHNQGSAPTPIRFKENDNGEQIDEAYPEWTRLRIDIDVNAEDSAVKLQMLRAIQNVFRPYYMWRDPDDFLPDTESISVNGTTAGDDADQEPVERSDIMQVTMLFTDVLWRFESQGKVGHPIQKTSQTFDEDGTESDEPEPTYYETTEPSNDGWFR